MPKGKATLESVLAKPTVFIGSSSKGLWVAKRLRRCLAHTARCTIWTQGVFGLAEGTLESLVKATKKYDFAVLVLTPDDLAKKQGKKRSIPRDNVIFELGLFMGALGKERTFIVQSRHKLITLPSDLDGITRAEFSGEDLKEACTKLQRAMHSAPSRVRQLTGHWYSSYQRHDSPVGQWVEDMTEVQSKPPGKLSFKNYKNPVDSTYDAVGELSGEKEIVGIWRETVEGAHASGTFHLYIDPFGRKLYGVCTGPSVSGEHLYSGWILVRDDPAKLKEARRELTRAMLVCRLPRIARPRVVKLETVLDRCQSGSKERLPDTRSDSLLVLMA